MHKRLIAAAEGVLNQFKIMFPVVEVKGKDGFVTYEQTTAVKGVATWVKRLKDLDPDRNKNYLQLAARWAKDFKGHVNFAAQKYGLALSHKKEWAKVVGYIHQIAEDVT